MKSKFDIQDTDVDLDFHITFTERTDNEETIEKNNALVKRIEGLIKQINGFMSTMFWEEVKNAKPVQPPIMQTSILLKNIDYKNCYTLWL